MSIFKKLTISAIALLSFMITMPSYSQPTDVDKLFRTTDLMKLIGIKDPVNLQAQLLDPNASTRRIEDLNNFIVRGVVAPSYDTVTTEFDSALRIIHKRRDDSTWVGVQMFQQKEIPTLSLQDGMTAVRACMQGKGKNDMPEEITGVVIYKSLINSGNIIYDYIFKKVQSDGNSVCQEYLYVPNTQECFQGMAVACHIDVPESVTTAP